MLPPSRRISPLEQAVYTVLLYEIRCSEFCNNSLTLTSHTGIFNMNTVSCVGVIGAIEKSILKSPALHIINVNRSSALAKGSKYQSSSIYKYVKTYSIKHCTLYAMAYYVQSIPVVCRLQQHQQFPRSHHRLCPTHDSNRPPLCLHTGWFRLPI